MRSGSLIGLLLAVAALLVARARLDVVQVRGRSMAPTLLPGDRLLVARLPARVGDIVLAHDPREPRRELIKRVAAVDAEGVVLRGDNAAASTDARTFGAVPAEAAAWRVVGRYWPADRIGRVPSAPALRPVPDDGGEPACTFPDALIAGGSVPASAGSVQLRDHRQ
jgi:nickel-type superoxide dismutase maturation protease